VVFHLFQILIKIYLACRVKLVLNKILANQFQTYLLFTFIILNFKKIILNNKPNVGMDVFKMKNKKLSNLLSCVFVKNCHTFGGQRFWPTLTCFHLVSMGIIIEN
jgi:hypothetical protein